MPRYFLHVMDGRALVDNEGSEFPDLNRARGEAIRIAGKILQDEGTRFWEANEWRMTVCDAAGDSVFTLRFSANNHER